MKQLKFINGIGYKHQKEVGLYEVRTEKRVKTFTSLLKARKYYNDLMVIKTIWNVKTQPNELLEYHGLISKPHKIKNN
jgi:hypothetical protein